MCIYKDILAYLSISQYIRVYTYHYLAISTENVLILTSELVDHVYNVAETSMMQSEPTVLPPGVSLSKGCTFLEARHHTQHTPCTRLA